MTTAAEPTLFDPAARSGWMLIRLMRELETLGAGASREDAQRAAEADAGVPIVWVEPDLAYVGWSAAVRVPGEASARGYLIEHRLTAMPLAREARLHASPADARSRQGAFLTAFGEIGTINGAARRSEVPATNHYRWLSTDPRYAWLFHEVQQRVARRPA